MRLINTTTLAPEEFIGSGIPSYAILSHTWEEDEATYADWRSPGGLHGDSKGMIKIRNACELARKQGYRYIWVDTCCIDKSSSAELTEAINSMFQWYQNARVCYAFLSDLGPTEPLERMEACRWYTRGWTLQELIAPKSVEFYDQAWQYRGDKAELIDLISLITHIDRDVLLGTKSPEALPVARKMAWAAHRNTTREEDIAYCLLGIFGVNLPLIYGEGPKAFIRLQEEIIKQLNDLSVFCWRGENQGSNVDETESEQFRGVLATSPREFYDGSDYINDRMVSGHGSPEFTITNKGIRIRTPLWQDIHSGLFLMCIDPVRADQYLEHATGIWLKRYGNGASFARARPHELPQTTTLFLLTAPSSERYLTKTIPQDLGLHVANSKPNQFTFDWDSGSPYYHQSATKPRSGWSQDEKIFVASEGPFVGIHYFGSRWATAQEQVKFVLAFGKAKPWLSPSPWFCIWQPDEPMFETAIFWDGGIDEIETAGITEFQRTGPSVTLELRRDLSEPRVSGELGARFEAEPAKRLFITISLSYLRPTAYGGWVTRISFSEPTIMFENPI